MGRFKINNYSFLASKALAAEARLGTPIPWLCHKSEAEPQHMGSQAEPRNQIFWLRRMQLLVIIFFTIVCSHASVFAQEQDAVSRFVAANNAYEAQQFDKAADQYESLVNQGINNGNLFFNLGNVHFRLNNLGQSIGYYLKALAFLPRNEDVIANLSYVRQQTKDQKEKSDQSTFSWREIADNWLQNFTLKEWILALIVCNALFWGTALIRLHYKNEALSWFLVLCGGSTLFFFAATSIKWWAPEPVGVILSEKIKIYSAPNAQSTILFQLHEGTAVVLEDEEDQWAKIRFESAKKGWVEKQSIFIVRPEDS